jgi:hypothetical protein
MQQENKNCKHILFPTQIFFFFEMLKVVAVEGLRARCSFCFLLFAQQPNKKQNKILFVFTFQILRIIVEAKA